MGALMTAALMQVDRLFREGTLAALTDDRLLDRFLNNGDPDAFAALVARHGSMVLRTCLDRLGDPADAEDAFQATFLVLVRRAGAIRGRECIGGWLRRVARRCARRASIDIHRRRRRERIAVDGTPSATEAFVCARLERAELGHAIGAEIDRLPEAYRRTVVLCLLEGLPQPVAADRLRVSEGVIRGRLARARAMLRDRLARRGIAPDQPAGKRTAGTDAPLVPVALVGWAAMARSAAAALIMACIVTLAAGLGRTPEPEPPAATALRLPPRAPAPRPQLFAKGPRAAAESGRTVVLHGKVFDPEGRPLAGARLHLLADAWADPVEQGISGDDGFYRLVVSEETFRKNLSKPARDHGQAEADGERGEDTRLHSTGRRVRFPGIHVRANVFSEDRRGPYRLPAVKEKHSARGRESPRADRPIGNMARDHNAGEQSEPHAARVGELLPSRDRQQGVSGARRLHSGAVAPVVALQA